ncbi:unnamed protein product [Phytomonas sp. Hart1]|nr:unnamed protein product [Phytomonas sp. Hart1]|eukprot:CCW70736.1 unnamed protein product [Phytomonas sp. isolate Hart1]
MAEPGPEGAREWGLVGFRFLKLSLGVCRRLAGLRYAAGEWDAGLLSFPPSPCLLLSGIDFQHGKLFAKIGLHVCLGCLSTLDLAQCGLGDDGLIQLAAALEKASVGSPLQICDLLLAANNFGDVKNKSWGALSFLCKALRAPRAPHLRVLDLSHNRFISLRPICALVEMVSSTLRELNLSNISIPERAQEQVLLLTAVMHRQEHRCPTSSGGAQSSSETFPAFEYLDLKAVTDPDERIALPRELSMWLHNQTAIHFVQYLLHTEEGRH